MGKEIILMRHREPNLATLDRVSALGMKRWIEQYDLSEITNQPVPKASWELAGSAKVIVSSSAPRALTSIRALGLQPTIVDEIFCEAQLPYDDGHCRDFHHSRGHLFFVFYGCAVSPGMLSLPARRGYELLRQHNDFSPLAVKAQFFYSVMDS